MADGTCWPHRRGIPPAPVPPALVGPVPVSAIRDDFPILGTSVANGKPPV
ncbi:MAG: hypothetical protein LBP92_15740 [Deltaproteobacteria bacterium]|nr:hypothetical protein [Deltaproteobacteria bacterium]